MKKLIAFIILCLFSSMAKTQPCTNTDEYFRKRHKIDGMTYGHPYTMFDRHNNQSLNQTLDKIRTKIKIEYDPLNPGPVYTAYLAVYNNAILAMPADNGLKTIGSTTTSYSQKAVWAKNNAFVFLVGLDASGRRLDSLDPTYSSRNAFRDRALTAFDNLTGKIQPHEPLTIYFSNTDDGNMQHHSRSLILWLQAYDFLKASAALPEMDNIKYFNNYDSDANKDWCSPRNKLRHLSRDLYQMSKGWLGMVAVVTT
jgi:hypothetical protein